MQPSKNPLVRLLQHHLDSLHKRYIRIFRAVLLHLGCLRHEGWWVDHRVPVIAVIVGAHPDRDELRVGDFVGGELQQVIFETSSVTCARAGEAMANVSPNTIPVIVLMTSSVAVMAMLSLDSSQ
jgi:hypothetical protein